MKTVKSKSILGYPPLFFTGVEFSGKKTSLSYILNKSKIESLPFKLLKRFTSDIELSSKNELFVYFPKQQFENAVRKNEAFSYTIDNNNNYQGYFKVPLYDSIAKSNCICVGLLDYKEVESLSEMKMKEKSLLLNYNVIHLIPDSPVLLAEALFNLKYSKMRSKNEEEEEEVYSKLHDEINVYGDKILEMIGKKDLFQRSIMNLYTLEGLYSEIDSCVNQLYPFLSNEHFRKGSKK